MKKKELTLSDLRKVRGGVDAAKKKTTSENVTGTVRHICDCSSEAPAS